MKQIHLRKNFLKILPYLASLIAGLIFIGIGFHLNTENENLKDLFINISASFFAIPLIFLFYQTAQNYSQKRLNREIFEYAKIQVDREVLSIITQLSKLIYNYKNESHTFADLNNLFSLKIVDIEKKISNKKILGFKLFKNWNTIEKNLENVLMNPYILKKLENDQIIIIVNLIKNLEQIKLLQKKSDLFIDTGEKIKGYTIANGNNNELPERYLLLKEIKIKNKENTFIVKDFGDFYKYDAKKLLNFFIVNELYVKMYSTILFHLLEEINNWATLTGSEILIDLNKVRLAPKSSLEKN